MANELAERYAQGLFELTVEENSVEQTKKEAEDLLSVLSVNDDLQLFFKAVKIGKSEKKSFVDRIFSKSFSLDFVNFLKLLIDKGRIGCLEDILKAYVVLADEKLGIERAVVTSARPLSEEYLQEIKKTLATRTGKKILLKNTVDPSLIAGIRVTVGNKVTDITMATKIESMRNALLKGGQA